MKILSIKQIREADKYTIEKEPILSIDLMERAALGCFKWIKKRINPSQNIKIFCGKGNNGGDGLVVARLLHEKGYNIEVVIINHSNNTSEDFASNRIRLKEFTNLRVHEVNVEDQVPRIDKQDIVIDAILGSGLSKPISGLIGDVIQKINLSEAVCISIDTPSGLFSDSNNQDNSGKTILADYTLTFQFPKYSFLLAENNEYVGNWHIIDIGLHKEYINSVATKNFFVTIHDIKSIIHPRKKFDHKGTFGHGLLISGGLGKMGAAVLASQACLRSGIGLLTAHIPQCGYQILQTTIPEAMISLDESNVFFTGIKNISQYDSIGVGPGIGVEEETQNALKLLIQNCNRPLVLDADALNILSMNKTWVSFLPKYSIITPHPKEFERLTEKVSSAFERIELQREFAIKHQIVVILKGAHTTIATPNGSIFFNSTGNPGMATAGSGDVLTGIILSLLAQGYSSEQASILGVYIHGLAGDIAAKKYSPESLIASDITTRLPNAFTQIHETN